MEQEYVSVWVGTWENEEAFYRFSEFTFNENADEDDEYDGYECAFAKEFNIDLDDIDEDFMEVYYKNDIISPYELLEGCSYYESFKEQIKDRVPDKLKGNSFVLLYDYKYKGKMGQSKHGMTFVGTFNYEK